METGVDSISDPAMGAGIPDVGFIPPKEHPNVPLEYLIMSRYDGDGVIEKAEHKDAMRVWEIEQDFIV
eukprot:CAMPEP_0174822890 /NCGR_PEP_ID=MMETSP1107-20130205/19454_1 /TAXON_ID=36770 /ORGANISM="Paraphysomonas vestita, Strain GFlagA" /LENGTH=67 /DNA_ID=CAMNT_0016043259 /DNA_START=1802 /DNA_END=2005 /DNA_ORIENTATION=+